jgi:hypothetical protein
MQSAEGPCTAARDIPFDVLTTRRLSNRGASDVQSDRDVAVIGKFAASSEADFTTTVDGTAKDLDIVAVFDENGIVAIVREIDVLDSCTTRLRYAEYAASATARDDLVDIDVGVVCAIRVLTVVVRHAKGRVAIPGGNIGAVDEANPRVGRLLYQQATLADITRDDLGDVEPVDVPSLHCVAARAPVTSMMPIVTFEFAAWSRSKRMPNPPLRFIVMFPSQRPRVP